MLIGSTAVGLMLAAVPAAADPPFQDPQSSVITTQLALHGGAGRLVLQARVGRDEMTGFEVRIPAGAGSWTGATDVAVPSLGAHCHDVGTGQLLYVCSAPGGLPLGSYQVSLPVRRVGASAGLIGQISIVRTGLGSPYLTPSDTFPVVDGSVRSTAEARFFDTVSAGSVGRQYGDLAEIVTVAPGEHVTAIDTVMPSPAGLTWRLTAVTGPGLTCVLLPIPAGQVTIRCRNPLLGVDAPIPASRFVIVYKLSVAGVVGRLPATGSIALTVDGHTRSQDTFAWRQNLNN